MYTSTLQLRRRERLENNSPRDLRAIPGRCPQTYNTAPMLRNYSWGHIQFKGRLRNVI